MPKLPSYGNRYGDYVNDSLLQATVRVVGTGVEATIEAIQELPRDIFQASGHVWRGVKAFWGWVVIPWVLWILACTSVLLTGPVSLPLIAYLCRRHARLKFAAEVAQTLGVRNVP